MAKIIIEIADVGVSKDSQANNVKFSVYGIKNKKDPKWVNGVALAVKQAVEELLNSAIKDSKNE